MKNMKKWMTSILVLALATTLCLPALAAGNNARLTDEQTSTTIDVIGNFTASAEPDAVISADVTWDNLTFTYKDGDKTWDAENHRDIVGEGGWVAEQKTITVTNHSNIAISAEFGFSAKTVGIVGTFTKTEIQLDSAVGIVREDAPTDHVEFSISGSKISSDQQIGTISVTVGEAYTLVSTEAELNNAVQNGKTKIKLENDITMTESHSWYDLNGARVIDLNGNTLAASNFGPIAPVPVHVNQNCTMTIKNGTLKAVHNPDDGVEANAVECYYGGNLTLVNCTLKSYSGYALKMWGGIVTLKDCKINSQYSDGAIYNVAVWHQSAVLTFSGNTTIICNAEPLIIMEDTSSGDTATTVCLPGTYNFDPTAYVDKSIYNVTNDGSTWIVTKK